MGRFKVWGRKLVVPAAMTLLPILALADVSYPAGSELTLDKIQDIISRVANWLIIVGIIIAAIYIVWGGVSYMAARGDATKAKTARDHIVHGIIGAVVVLGVGVILRTAAAFVTRTFFGVGQ